MSLSKSYFKNIISSPALHVIIIITVVSLCFGRTIGSYFLADDLGEIKYCWKIFQGDWGLLLSNFTGNYMQIPLMNVYRPTLLCSLLFDYLFWQGNASGYYLSNLIYFSADCLLLYAVIKLLFQDWEPWRAKTTALFSALIFAASPLHCESISWIVGRVDSLCCFFFLASLLFFLSYTLNKKKTIISKPILKQKINFALIASLLFYVLALTTKEMAIGLPLIITAISFIWSEEKLQINSPGKNRLYQRLLLSWHASYSFWACTLIYLIVRYMALGTIFGGYSGSIGESQQISILTRWLDIDTIKRLFFPFPQQVFAQWSIYSTVFLVIYVIATTIIILKIAGNLIPWRYFAFFIVWLITACVPIYKLWGLGYDLEGARFCFFLTLATSTFLPVLLLAPDPKGILKPLTNKLLACSLVLLSVLVIASSRATYLTNIIWVHAGREVQAVSIAAQKLAGIAKPGEKIILLGIPKENAGAHMILNGKTFQMLLSPPFVPKACWQPFLTFDPIVYGPPQFINASRLKQLLAHPWVTGPFIWQSQTKDFCLVKWHKNQAKQPSTNYIVNFNSPTTPSSWMPYVPGHALFIYQNGQLIIKNCQSGDGIRIDNINASPLDIDYLVLEIKQDKFRDDLSIQAVWNLNNPTTEKMLLSQASSIQTPGTNQTVSTSHTRIFIPLSHYWRWYEQTSVTSLAILFPQARLITVSKLTLLPAQKVAPQMILSSNNPTVPVASVQSQKLSAPVASPSTQLQRSTACLTMPVALSQLALLDKLTTPYGTYLLSKSALLAVNAQEITGTKFIEIQISKKDYFFDNIPGSNLFIEKTLCQTGSSCRVLLNPNDFVGSGYFQVRACALNEHKDPIGTFSDTITLEK